MFLHKNKLKIHQLILRSSIHQTHINERNDPKSHDDAIKLEEYF